uniref:UNC80 domain-containing protein n=1 Tax=Ascaris lumbricoides TaxID=6252 RepID=A0A0M3IAB7_ASCLU
MLSADDDANELESVPLPIQTFLWRQTNPFLGAKIGKLHEASCVTFERVVVQNILHGLSPSLSDAIGSVSRWRFVRAAFPHIVQTFERVVVQNILHGLSPSLSDAIGSVSRWRFVRAAFPHIVQCCASLIAEATTREEGSPISASLTKILYILHWLLLDSANECCDSDSGKTFERVVVQNILHGLSPSLSDAIGSVSRWRFVRAAFPHIVQCCASLIAEATTREEGSPISASLTKILYILHWLLLDSANECCDSDSGKATHTEAPIDRKQKIKFFTANLQKRTKINVFMKCFF